jgi:hypothetical protein
MTTLDNEGPESPLHTLLSVAAVTSAGCRTMRLIGNHALDLGHVGLVKHHISIELALALGAFGSQDVALERMAALDLARTCLLEALGRSAMSFQLRHKVLLLQHKCRNAASDDAFTTESTEHFLSADFLRVSTDLVKSRKQIRPHC